MQYSPLIESAQPVIHPRTPYRILVVEDMRELSAQLAQQLHQNGFETETAERGDLALQLLRTTEPDLVILDWMLPGLSGLEVLRQYRSFSHAPVLMVSAMASDMDRVLGLELGADDYMAKPFSMQELMAKVRALLRRARQWQQQTASEAHLQVGSLRHGDLLLEPSSHRVLVGSKTIHLTKTEFGLLHLFMKNPSRVFSRNYLLETLWPEIAAGCDRSVDNTVLKLRKKLKPWGDQIETVWGIGYRLALWS